MSSSPLDPADDLLGLRFEPERSSPGQRLPAERRHRTAPGGDAVEMLDDDAIEIGEEDLALDTDFALAPGSVDADGGLPFRIDDDLFARPEAPPGGLGLASSPDWVDPGGCWPPTAADLPGPAFALAAGLSGDGECGAPIIDRDEEVPERCWAPEVAGLGRRSLALLVDQLLLLTLLGLFFLGAFAAFRLVGFDTGVFLAAAGLQASALPFALLGALLSFCYSVFFHGTTGRTPGKALMGIAVRTGDGAELTWSRTVLRWLGAFLGLVCGGVGVFWAVFEPRRRGWADLLSGTVVARPRRGAGLEETSR